MILVLLLLPAPVLTGGLERSVEVNPNHMDGERIELPVSNATVDTFLTLCYRVLHKHFLRLGTDTTVFRYLLSTLIFLKFFF